MTRTLLQSLAFTGLSLLSLDAALAAPILKAEIVVATSVVTVGDMFEDAGTFAEAALFRAPAPGTSGLVPLAAVRDAAARIGLDQFDTDGLDAVRVARAGTIVTDTMLIEAIAGDLYARGILTEGMSADVVLDTEFDGLNALPADNPVQLASLRYLPGRSAFAARFQIAGSDKPFDVAGSIELMIDAAHLRTNLPAGAVLSQGDIELRRVPLKYAESSGFVPPEQLIGKALQHPSRAGLMLRANDVAEPQLISRNDAVTVYFRNGPLVLTAKGQALNAASLGQPVSVLNQISKKVIHGVAAARGAVEIRSGSIAVAGL